MNVSIVLKTGYSTVSWIQSFYINQVSDNSKRIRIAKESTQMKHLHL